jgi:serine/threonine protein kinase, bacterial
MTTEPTHFGKYELLELLGEGGMASVFRAVLSGPGGFRKQVALKQIRPNIASDDKMVQLMFNEARLGGHLRHKNIVEVYDFGQEGDTYYLAIEFVDGFTLADLLLRTRDRGPIPARIVANVVMQVCQALAYAHAAADDQGRPMRLVHRDLKPANVMVRRDGLVKLADFGIAKAETNVTHTTTGLTRGTPAYMSPEQVTGGKSAPLDHRSDLFSLASITAELLTGERAFGDEQMLDLMNRIAAADVAEPLDRVVQVAPPFLPVLRTAFQRMPVDRFEDAAAMGKEVRRIYDKLPPAEERLTSWLADWMGTGVGAGVGPDAQTALVGDDALVSPTPGATESVELAATQPSTPVEAALETGSGRLPDDACDTLETVVEPIPTPPPGEEWPATGVPERAPGDGERAPTPAEQAPGTAAFFGSSTDGAPELSRLSDPGGDEPPPPPRPPPRPVAPPRPEPRRRSRRRASPGGKVPVVSVQAARKASGEQLAVMEDRSADRSGLTWSLIVVALAVVLAVPALAWKLELFGAGEGDPGEVTDPDEAVEPDPDAPDERAPVHPGDRRPRPDREQAGGKLGDPPTDGAADDDDPDAAGIETPAGREPGLDPALEALAGKVKIKGCFRKHRGRLGELPPVTVSFVVAPGGSLSEAQVLRPEELDESLAKCLVGALEGMKLPKAAADEPVTRRYTFRRSGSGAEG